MVRSLSLIEQREGGEGKSDKEPQARGMPA